MGKESGKNTNIYLGASLSRAFAHSLFAFSISPPSSRGISLWHTLLWRSACQLVFVDRDYDKQAKLEELLDQITGESGSKVLVFCKTKRSADYIEEVRSK